MNATEPKAYTPPAQPQADALEAKLRQLGRIAASPAPKTNHVVDEPLLALIRNGDKGDDIADAILHLAHCAACRALLTEGQIERRSVVVVAIEAPRTSQRDIEKFAEGAQARLVERGSGRWMAVVSADRAETFHNELNKSENALVSRIAVTKPIDVPVNEPHASLPSRRKRSHSVPPVPSDRGTDAAEVAAWALIPRAPRKKVQGPSPAWVLFAVIAVCGAALIAYLLATRMP